MPLRLCGCDMGRTSQRFPLEKNNIFQNTLEVGWTGYL